MVVPDVQAARAVLSINGFRANPGFTMTVTDRISKVEVDLLPGNGAVGPGPMLLPLPTLVSAEPVIADLQTLIEIKLSSYLGSPKSRLRDLADVIELMKANQIDRDIALDERVASTYRETWDGLAEETAR